ncbi:aminotransferase DegT [Candidatus Woesearchaeota archaeon]|nr:DegT/DnrJ/EryC1/StrS family aminotransferase [Candidatus Woesearchaeota archaeon]RLE41705.1 MAG: aminotransferase DegT [Candidatus Woesearchaeota archaeon]
MIPIASPVVGDKELGLIKEVLKSGIIAQGPKVALFEKRFAQLCNTKFAIAVNSGTAALHCCTYALGIRQGDEVITVPFTFVATANSILMQGAKPVFVDICEETFNIDPSKIEAAITPNTKAIIAVNLYGQPADYNALREIAAKHNLRIIEDAAQSVGAEFNGEKSGSLGDIAAFSFYATKNLVTGEGGMITTNNPEFAELCKRFRHHGQSEKTRYEYFDLGYNYRMTDIMAAIGLAQLERLPTLTEIRQRNAQLLNEGLAGVKGIVTPKLMPNATHVYHQYTIRVTPEFPMTRDELAAYLKENGFGCGIYYPKPLHLHPHFQKLGYKLGDFPVSEKLAKEVLSLPVHPKVTPEQLHRLIGLIRGVK